MGKMRALVAWLLAAALLLPAPSAGAHHAESFEACWWHWAFSGGYCERGRHRTKELALTGDGVILRAVVRPTHRNHEAELWRRAPCTGVFRRFKVGIEIHRWGGMVWRWETDEDDANISCSYGFQFRIPGHGRSNKVRLWVIPPDY